MTESNPGYTQIQQTLISASSVDAPVTALAFKGKDAALVVDSSAGVVTQQIAIDLLKQAVVSQLLVRVSAGTNDITLTLTSSTDENVRAKAIQTALGLNTVGSAVVAHFVKTGTAAALNLGGDGSADFEVIAAANNATDVLIEASNVTAGAEALIMQLLSTV